MDTLTMPQSTPIYVPSTVSSAEEWWTSLRRDFPASPTPLQESNEAQRTKGISGLIPSESLARWNPLTSYWKTYQASFIQDMEALSSDSFPRRGMTVSGELYPLPMWGPPTEETDGGAWPTPEASNGTVGEIPAIEVFQLKSGRLRKRLKSGETGSLGLAREVGLWMTPTVALEGTKTQHDGSYKPGLKTQAALWRTPDAWLGQRGPKSQGSFEDSLENGTHAVNLLDQVKHWGTPTARDYRTGEQNQPVNGLLGRQAPRTLMPGQESSAQDQTLPQQWGTPQSTDWKNKSHSRDKNLHSDLKAIQSQSMRLNPLFVEWLMGLPIEWSGLKPLETESYQAWWLSFSEE